MRNLILLLILGLPVACSQVGSDEARSIAYERLSASSDGPSLQGAALLGALQVTKHDDGTYLVELIDEGRNLLWAVIVLPSGESEITRMAVDG